MTIAERNLNHKRRVCDPKWQETTELYLVVAIFGSIVKKCFCLNISIQPQLCKSRFKGHPMAFVGKAMLSLRGDLMGEGIRTGGAAFCVKSSGRYNFLLTEFLPGEGIRTGSEAFCIELAVRSVASGSS